jgi:predicted nucleic acid-binding protein
MEPTTSTPPPVLGFDTGFFRRLYDGDDRARAAWADVRAGRAAGVVSCLSLFELDRLGLRGALPQDVAGAFVQALPATCRVVWLGADDGADRLHRAARRAHGVSLAMADALILTSLLDADASTVYTTDGDFQRYDGPVEIVTL